MNESTKQYLRLAVERKCRVLSRMFETCTRDEQRSNNPPEIDLKLSAIAKALARGLQVVEAHAGSLEPSDLGVLQSFNETVFSDVVAGYCQCCPDGAGLGAGFCPGSDGLGRARSEIPA